MSVAGPAGAGQLTQQLQQDLQYELTTANQLLRLISMELQQIKKFTNAGEDFERNIKQNTSLCATLASMQNVNLENLPPVARVHNMHTNQNKSNEEHNTFRNESEMDDSQ